MTKISKGFLVISILLATIIVIGQVKIIFNKSNLPQGENNQATEEQKVEEIKYLSKSDREEELSYYESLYSVCIYRIENEGMNDYLAEDIRKTISYKIPEIAALSIEDKYKDNLLDALTGIMISMEEYLNGNLDKSVEWVERAEQKYNLYKQVKEDS